MCPPPKKQHTELSPEGFIVCPWGGAPGLLGGLLGAEGPSYRSVGSAVAKRVGHQAIPVLLLPALDVVGAAVPGPHDHGVSGRQGWVLREEVERPEQEAHGVSGCGGVRDVLGVGDVQEAHSDPGHQVLRETGMGRR